ncbi:MKRN2 opposite strand protein [Octopus bimaculoides]|uniref:MKRN2 opposite strand protein n=1 Tax=Octopus bimaculoides TaxID=37653 RepID=A0A0L8HRP1_OCTBM|nr:MKRN2 opposite strand protein [Octopus bimaculoides]|eukprot:XP_014769966.1 PREDICTED: MKRN2 opposite strand protein-like [Octopus bimaculoides]
MDNEEDFDIIRCFQHCSNKTNIFYCRQLPTTCPLCSGDVINSDSLLPPYRIESPFIDAVRLPFAVVVKPTQGTFLQDYQNAANLHIGVTNSQGVVYEYDENGITIGSISWTCCIAVSFSDLLTNRLFETEWDGQLARYSQDLTWVPQRYHEEDHNCFSFVTSFLKLNGVLPADVSKQHFLTQFLIKHTTKGSKYISLYRQIVTEGYLCQPAQAI